MTRWLLVAVTALALAACGSGLGTDVRSGSARLVIDSPRSGQVLSVRSVGIAVHVEGADQYRLHYYVDGNDRGEGDTSQTETNVTPGTHHVEVEALHADGSAFSPPLRASVDFVIQ
jgi:predicted small secreted protein